jgi:hypothetical protein
MSESHARTTFSTEIGMTDHGSGLFAPPASSKVRLKAHVARIWGFLIELPIDALRRPDPLAVTSSAQPPTKQPTPPDQQSSTMDPR